MLTSAQRQRGSRPRSQPQSLPAPVGGWNTRDSLAAMDPLDAYYMENVFPDRGKVSLRNGMEAFASGMTSDVEALIEYHARGNRDLLAAANGNIYDITSGGAASSLKSGFSSNRWQGTNFNGFALLVNGTDAPQTYDGTSVTNTGWSGSGLTTSDLIGVHAHKARLYLWEDATQDFWYGATNAVTGSLTKFPLSRVGNFGGNLAAVNSWTVDAGDGPDDFIVFFMSSGEAVVYQGADPSSWSLVGVYNMSPVLGIRTVIKVGPDLVAITRDDYISMTKIFREGYLGSQSKASGALRDKVADHASKFGWQAVLHDSGNKIIFNVPLGGDEFEQHVMNTLTGAFTKFTGWNGVSWAVFNNALYFGGTDGRVYKADTGQSDDGATIQADVRQAWSDLGIPQTKRVPAARPVLEAAGSFDYEFGLGYDFENTPVAPATASTEASAIWDEAVWDVAEWSDEDQVDVDWAVAGGFGTNVSTRLRLNSSKAISWLRTDFKLEAGVNL